MAKCRLCHENKTLHNSHILPEFLYGSLYNEQHQLMGITGLGHKGWKPLQKGIREHLFCFDCEQLLNDRYEKTFLKQWTIDSPLPNHISTNAMYSAIYDYSTFKLFHLSILFRCSVSSLPTFEEVHLGAHEDRIRKMLISGDPGNDWEYPIIAFAVLNKQGEIERRIITRPYSFRYEGHRTFRQIYGGALWWISVSSHRNHYFCEQGLKPTGHISIAAMSWAEIPEIKVASYVLKHTT